MFSHDPFTVVIDESHHLRDFPSIRDKPRNIRAMFKKKNVNRDKIKAARKQKRKNTR